MKIRTVLKISVFGLLLLFFLFSIVEIKYSLPVFLFLVSVLLSIRVYEVYSFYRNKKKYLRLGSRKNFNSILLVLASVVLLYVFIRLSLKFDYLIPKFDTSFSKFFVDMRFFYGIIIVVLIKELILNNTFFYMSKSEILTQGNEFPTYNISDFKSYLIIEEQNLIRFKKQNNKFLFVEYDKEYFNKNKKLIIERLEIIKK